VDTNVGWDVDSMILSCEGADREQDDVGQENAEETLVAETHPESPRKTLDAEDSPISSVSVRLTISFFKRQSWQTSIEASAATPRRSRRGRVRILKPGKPVNYRGESAK